MFMLRKPGWRVAWGPFRIIETPEKEGGGTEYSSLSSECPFVSCKCCFRKLFGMCKVHVNFSFTKQSLQT